MDTNSDTSAAQASLHTFIGKVEKAIIDPIIVVITLAAFILFAWGIVEFIMGAGEEEKRRTGKQHMLWGAIGLAIMFGAQAILLLLKGIVGK